MAENVRLLDENDIEPLTNEDILDAMDGDGDEFFTEILDQYQILHKGDVGTLTSTDILNIMEGDGDESITPGESGSSSSGGDISEYIPNYEGDISDDEIWSLFEDDDV